MIGAYLDAVWNQVIRCNRTGKSRGYGFVSFGDPVDFATALKEKQGAYIGNRYSISPSVCRNFMIRPCKLRKSSWKEKNDPNPLKKFRKRSDRRGNRGRVAGSILHK